MATEWVRCPVHTGCTLDSPDSEAGKILKESLDELTQQEGFQRLYWGMEVENPEVFRLLVDWDSIDTHRKFMASPAYKPFVDGLGKILDLSKMQMFHAHMSPHPPEKALSDRYVPVTECITTYFPASYSKADQDKLVSGMEVFMGNIEKNDKTYRGAAGGWAEEEQSIPDTNGEQGRVYVHFIAWDSVQDHLNFRTTQTFKDNVHHLRGAKDLKSINVSHCSFKEVTKS